MLLALFLVKVHMTTSSAYIPMLILLFVTVFGKSFIYALKVWYLSLLPGVVLLLFVCILKRFLRI